MEKIEILEEYKRKEKSSKNNKTNNKFKDKCTSNNKLVLFIYNFLKRILDIASGIIGIILLFPITIFVYLFRILNHENQGPLFYKQVRIGKNGKQFKIYKFRSMCINAEEKLEKYLRENNQAREEYEKYKKLKNDPRITKTGKFIRNTSIDEFPQFINILIGNMSLVGPRPYLPKEKKSLREDYYNQIIKVKPGLTGYWQVNGRNNKDFDMRAYLDIYYIGHRSFYMDIKIIIKTFLKIFGKEGAM